MDTQIEQLRRNWGWILALGVISVVWGLFAIAYSVFFTAVSVFAIAGLLIVAGIIEAVYAFRHEGHAHMILYVLEAVLAIAAGALLLRSPAAGALVITLLLATYFVVIGIIRIVASLSLRPRHWGWMMVSGLVSLALGIIVWGGWPATAFWVLGLFVGINLLFLGWSRILLAIALHSGHVESLPPDHPRSRLAF